MKKSKLDSLVINPINLQLFAEDRREDDNDSDNQPGVVDQEKEDYYDSDSETENYYDEDESQDEEENEEEENESNEDENERNEEENTDAYDTDKHEQTKKENEQFKKIRQQARADALKELSIERAKLNEERKELEAFRIQQRDKKIEEKHLSEITPELVSSIAYREGISEDLAKRLLTQEAINNANAEINSINLKITQAKAQKAELKDKPFFNILEKDIDDLILREPGVDPNTAYKYLCGERIDELIKTEKKNTEKRTIANIQDKARRRSIPAGSGNTELDAGKILSKDEIEMAIAFGNDPRKIARTVKEKLKDKKRR